MSDDQVMQAAILEVFTSIDTDGSGFIERDEVTRLVEQTCAALNLNEDEKEAVTTILMEICDGDGDGKISLAEFTQALPSIMAFGNQ